MINLHKPENRTRVHFATGLMLALTGWLSLPLYLWEHNTRSFEREKFAVALAAADAGVWFWNLEDNSLYWDDQMFRLYGVSKSKWTPDYNGFFNCLHPNDRDMVQSLVEEAIERKTGYQAIFKVIGDDEVIREIRASGRVSRDGKYMTGICLPAIHYPGVREARKQDHQPLEPLVKLDDGFDPIL